MNNLEILINMYNNQPDDAHVGCSPSSMEKITKMEETLMDEHEDGIVSFRLLDMDESNYRV